MKSVDHDDAKRFLAAWDKTYPKIEPDWFHDSWLYHKEANGSELRLHALPESKQYADSPGERREIVYRNLTLIYELGLLSGTGSSDLLVLASDQTHLVNKPQPQAAHDKIFPKLAHVKTFLSDPTNKDPEYVWWEHAYIARTSLDSHHLRQLILEVAEEKAWSITICPPGIEWLFHPYEGGCDIKTGNAALVETLWDRHKAWAESWDPEYISEPGRFTGSKTLPPKKPGPLDPRR